MASPSKVDVPLPISSSISSESEVAFFKIFATSFISIMNVDCPLERSSEAPTLVKILSTMQRFALDAGTNDPIWNISSISATCLM